MIEVRIPIPLDEYLHVLSDLESDFDKHGIICILSADTVIRTWAALMFHNWFDGQGHFVDHFVGWGEIGTDWDESPMLAAASAEMVNDGYQPAVVMTFEDEACDEAMYEQETADAAKNLAIMFKLAWGGGV